jgi:hypothetical protein
MNETTDIVTAVYTLTALRWNTRRHIIRAVQGTDKSCAQQYSMCVCLNAEVLRQEQLTEHLHSVTIRHGPDRYLTILESWISSMIVGENFTPEDSFLALRV